MQTLFEPIPKIRLRRNRQSSSIRSLVEETKLSASDFVAPLFVLEGENHSSSIATMPGIERYSIDLLLRKIEHLAEQGIQAIALFPSINPEQKSFGGEEAWNPNGLTAKTIRAIKARFPELCLIADVALDPYTSHGHDGLIDSKGEILNDETIQCLIRMALSQAEAGIDFVAPSDMMDGRVAAIRHALDKQGRKNVGILAYSAKYASSLYAPFREAVQVRLLQGDKKSYQLNPANVREALLEAKLDEEEGADILLVKPALLYLDIISKLRTQTHRPIAAFHVSGEYAMVMAAAQAGYLNAQAVFLESLVSIKRAGADLIFTYALDQILPLL